jgi:hypothetical protein
MSGREKPNSKTTGQQSTSKLKSESLGLDFFPRPPHALMYPINIIVSNSSQREDGGPKPESIPAVNKVDLLIPGQKIGELVPSKKI